MPYLVENDMVKAKTSFYELAKSRIRLRNQNDYYAFEKQIFGDKWERSTAVYFLSTSRDMNANKWVKALEISVNTDFFVQENADLIPYVVEHEIYEAWLWTKRGYIPQTIEARHLLARRREYEMAMKHGKAEKLLSFQKKLNPAITKELEYAYQKARDKRKHFKPQE